MNNYKQVSTIYTYFLGTHRLRNFIEKNVDEYVLIIIIVIIIVLTL